jgi:hypothetical protein
MKNKNPLAQMAVASTWVFDQSFTDKTPAGITYVFPIKGYVSYPETFTTNKSNVLNNDIFTPATMATYLMDLYTTFLRVFGSKFAKPYTPAQLLRLTNHIYKVLEDLDSYANDVDEYEWTFVPSAIHLVGSKFNIIWHLYYKDIKIILADDSEPLPTQLEELDINAVVPSTDDFLRLNSTVQQREVMRLERARLKARMAKYQAERAMAKYLAKYGDYSETDGETDYDSSSDEDSDADEK